MKVNVCKPAPTPYSSSAQKGDAKRRPSRNTHETSRRRAAHTLQTRRPTSPIHTNKRAPRCARGPRDPPARSERRKSALRRAADRRGPSRTSRATAAPLRGALVGALVGGVGAGAAPPLQPNSSSMRLPCAAIAVCQPRNEVRGSTAAQTAAPGSLQCSRPPGAASACRVRAAAVEGWRWRARAGLEGYGVWRLPGAHCRPFSSRCGHAKVEREAGGRHWVWEERRRRARGDEKWDEGC